MSYLSKIISTKLPPYLYELIPPLQRSHRYPSCFQTFRCRTTFFQNSFLPFAITEWNKLDSDIKNIDSHAMFHKKLLAFIRPLGNDSDDSDQHMTPTLLYVDLILSYLALYIFRRVHNSHSCKL